MSKLKIKEIDELFSNCFFDKDEIINGRPTSEFTSVQSINPDKDIPIALSTKKLNNNKNDIIRLIDALPKIEEGNSLDNLYFDSDGNKWCNDIESLDKLIMMALSCGLVSSTIIESNEEQIVIIKRTKENDDLEVKGTDPKVFPEIKDNQIFRGYTEKEKKLIDENKIRITQELNNYIEIINIGLGFFKIHASINEKFENQLDFYDNENYHLFSKKFEDTEGIVGFRAILNQRLCCEFKDKFGNEINYLVDGDRHIFLLDSPSDKFYGYRVEIKKENDKKSYSKILVRIVDKDADYVIKEIEIDNVNLQVELNNQFGPFGNYEDGEKRHLWYRNSLWFDNPFFFMGEEEWPDKGHILEGTGCGFELDKKEIIGGLTYDKFCMLSTNIARHPRNKELILYTITELDKQLPGIKEFINNNFSLYDFIVNFEYQKDPFTEAIVQATIHEKCNLKEPSKFMLKKNEK